MDDFEKIFSDRINLKADKFPQRFEKPSSEKLQKNNFADKYLKKGVDFTKPRSVFNKKLESNKENEKKDDFGLFLLNKLTQKDEDIKTNRSTFIENLEKSKDHKMKIKLFIKCPGCFNDKSDASIVAEPKYWQHKICGTSVYIEETGFLSCEKDCKKFFIKKAKFYCNVDHGVEYTQYTDLQDMMMAISHGVASIKKGFADQSEVDVWAAMLAVNISMNWEKEN